MIAFIAGLLLFLGAHSVSILAPAWRDRMMGHLGANTWRGLYSLVAIGGFVSLLQGFGAVRHQWPVLYVAPPWMHPITALLMLPVFPLLLAAYLPGRIRQASKHPMLVATKLWALAHLLSNGSLADLLLFGSFLAWAVADRISLKHRTPRPTMTLPASRWNDAVVLAGGLLLYALFVLKLHLALMGVAPLAQA